MQKLLKRCLNAIPGILAVAALNVAAADAIKNSDCLECHSDKTLTKTNAAGKEVSLFVDGAKFSVSVHRTNSCASCHADLKSTHPDDNLPAQKVNCAQCHPKQSETYGASIHGQAMRAGKLNSATCVDCHDSHELLPSTLPESSLYFTRIAETCGQCHDQEAREVGKSVHGKATAAGKREAPTCTDCHSEHKIEALSGSSSRKISEDVCSRCHASERINTKFNMPADRVRTFFESYHGLAVAYGSTVTANCASCHGYHKVLPSSDPDSTINKTHIVETCGKCHPGANEKFVSGKIHVDIAATTSGPDIGDQINWWVRRLYLMMIVGVVGGMFVHNLLLFLRKIRARLQPSGRTVVRMSLSQRWQHAVLALSFIALAVTGFALKFPDSWVAKLLGSSEPFRRWSHRIAGIVMIGVGVYHIIYILASKDGRRLVMDLFPVKKDLADVWDAVRYLVGSGKEKPKIGRFGYSEKMEYWAVVWGTIIMGATGLMIWFKMDVTQWLPRWAVDIALTIHYYEALLACMAIVAWHFYHVIFDPDVYPLNPALWDGRVSKEWHEEEHPLDVHPPKDETSNPKPQEARKEGGQ